MSKRLLGEQPVIIVRSGYATDALWQAAIQTAVQHGRTVFAVALDGTVERRDPKEGA